MGFYSETIIPFLYDYSMNSKKINEGRKSLLGKITEEEILEIGFGTGINLQFYPQCVKRIIAIDKNPGMLKQAEKKISKSNIIVEHRTISSESLPFLDATFTSTISTYTLCSIENVESALHEVYRVLKPGGKLYFLEHGFADSQNIQRWQNRLNKFQNIWADGCNLNRNIKSLILSAGFKFEELENYYQKRSPKFVGFMYKGIAVKGNLGNV